VTLLFVYLEKFDVYFILIETPFFNFLDEATEKRLRNERSLHPVTDAGGGTLQKITGKCRFDTPPGIFGDAEKKFEKRTNQDTRRGR